MSEAVLVIVPSTYGVVGLQGFDGLKVVALDEVLFAGFSGVYFRRLLVQAALNPEKRVDYENKRKEYLRRVLQEKTFAVGTVFVGTRAADVDLMDFSAVYAVRVSDKGLRVMSRLVYGDPVLLYMDFMNVLAAVEEAVDDVFHVVEWAEIPLLIMRKFQARPEVDVVLHHSQQRAILADVLQGEQDAHVWLENEIYRSGNEKRTLLLADYDYLGFVRPMWRDSVLRLLGKAPSVVEVFRLPWYVVDTTSLSMLCYRPNAQAMPTASSRGYSLIQFVHTRLAGALTTREMVGTWVGGLLCDDLTAVDTIATLRSSALVSGGRASCDFSQREAAVRVPLEFAWAYAGVHSVSVGEWNGPRKLDNTPRVSIEDVGEWAFTLPFVELYSHVEDDPVMSACVVQFISRLHSVTVDRSLLRRLYTHACDVVVDGCSEFNFDFVLTPMLPGFNYLAAFIPRVRLKAVLALRCNPSLGVVMQHAKTVASVDAVVSVDEVCADAVRLMLFAGHTLHDLGQVGETFRRKSPLMEGSGQPGFCYECMFQPRYRAKARRLLRARPTFKRLMHWKFVPWYIEDVLDKVCVTRVSATLLHVQLGGRGLSLREFIVAAGGLRQRGILQRSRVGQSTVCYSATWYVAAIIAWTVVGCCLFGILMYFVYLRCSGKRGGGLRGRY